MFDNISILIQLRKEGKGDRLPSLWVQDPKIQLASEQWRFFSFLLNLIGSFVVIYSRAFWRL